MNSLARHLIKGLLTSIGLIYFFILPVYLPIRVLGIELNAYHQVLDNPVQLILYFSQVTLLIACNGILLSQLYPYFLKQLPNKNDVSMLHWYRVIALFFALIFIVSSYFVLTPSNLTQLYAWSGVHYFIIGFFQLLIRAEINAASRQGMSTSQANNYFGVCLNLSGMAALLIFSWYYSFERTAAYTEYCLWLEAGLFIYLFVGRQYVRSIYVLRRQLLSLKSAALLFALLLSLICSAIISEWFMRSGAFGAIFVLLYILFSYVRLKREIKPADLKLAINICLGYGLLLALLTGSIFTFFVKIHFSDMQIFNHTYAFEPLFSAMIGLIATFVLYKVHIDFSTEKLVYAVYILNWFVPVSLILFVSAIVWPRHVGLVLMLLFGLYAILEYMSLFYLRQVAQLREYQQHHGAKLTNFCTVTLNGLCPALLYLSVYLMACFGKFNLEGLLIDAIAIVTVTALFYNLWQRVGLKKW